MLDKKYDHLMVEKDKYETWKNNNYFKEVDKDFFKTYIKEGGNP